MSVWLVPIVGVVVVGGVVLWFRPGGRPTSAAGVWTCSMHPQVRMDRAGRCPICGMDLVPVEKLEQQKGQQEKQAGLETEEVRRRHLVKVIRAVGKLDYNESLVEVITARVAGRAERLYVGITGVEVKKGDHLVELYSEDLLSAQRELLLALANAERVQGTARPGEDRFAQDMLRAARDKLLLLGILPEQIEQLEKTRQPQTNLTIFAPQGGTVIEKQVKVGQRVQQGDVLYRIAQLDPIWLYLNIYEYDIDWIDYGQIVEVTLEAIPGETFQGLVTFIDPFLDDKTRAVRVRVNLKNPDLRLKPAMYASAVIRVPLRSDGTPQPTGYAGKYFCPMHPEIVRDETGDCPICQMKLEQVRSRRAPANAPAASPAGQAAGDTVLAIPASAILDTGVRQVAYRLTKEGAYELLDVQVGPRATDVEDPRRAFFPVFKGLNAGDRVIVSGGFMLDSQRQIEGMPSLLYPQGQSAASLHAGHGGTPSPPPASNPPAHKH